MLTFEQLQALIKGAGVDKVTNPIIVGKMTGGVAQRMAAIAIAESGDKNHPEKGANPKAHNPVPPDNSYGLWQINMIGNLGVERRKKYGLKSNEDLFDPATNARVAVAILRTQGPDAWSTFKNQSDVAVLKKLKEGGSDVASNFSVGEVTASVEDSVSGGILSGINALSKSIFGVALNAGVFLGAALLLVLGIILLMREPLASIARKTPVGKAASLAKKVS